MILDREATIWRKVAIVGGGYQDTQVYSRMACAIFPIASFGTPVPFAYESTHIIFVPFWLMLRKEDQVREGRELPDAEGDLSTWIYTIQGRRNFKVGPGTTTYYARELD